MSLTKPLVSPASLSESGELGASGTPIPSKSAIFLAGMSGSLFQPLAAGDDEQRRGGHQGDDQHDAVGSVGEVLPVAREAVDADALGDDEAGGLTGTRGGAGGDGRGAGEGHAQQQAGEQTEQGAIVHHGAVSVKPFKRSA